MPPILCQICKKNVATVHLTEIIKDKKREIHLCEGCARKKGLPLFKTEPVPGASRAGPHWLIKRVRVRRERGSVDKE
ncbi:MAG TPA: hypothetical protein VMZ92_13860 [Planctomycetota bacterium]|nr:hypothetical protein [Planctomycetota bacterium]